MKGQLRLASLLLMSASVCAIGLTSYTSECSCSSEGKGTVSQNDGMPDGLSAAAHGAVGDQMVDQFKGGDSMPDGLSMTARGIGLRGNNPSQQMPNNFMSLIEMRNKVEKRNKRAEPEAS